MNFGGRKTFSLYRRCCRLGSQGENSEAEVGLQECPPIRLRWLGLQTPGLQPSLAVSRPGNGHYLGLCGLRLCAAHTQSSGGHKGLMVGASGQCTPSPQEGGVTAVEEMPDEFVVIILEACGKRAHLPAISPHCVKKMSSHFAFGGTSYLEVLLCACWTFCSFSGDLVLGSADLASSSCPQPPIPSVCGRQTSLLLATCSSKSFV